MKTPAQHTSQHTSQSCSKSCTPIVRVNRAAALTWSRRAWGPSIATGASSKQLARSARRHLAPNPALLEQDLG